MKERTRAHFAVLERGTPDQSVLVADLYREQRRRLGFLCASFVSVFAIAYMFPRLTGIYPGGNNRWIADLSLSVTLGFVVILWVLAASRVVATSAVMTAAVWLEPVIALGISIAEGARFVLRSHELGSPYVFEGVSWACVLVLVYPFFVPSRWKRALVISLLSALTFPATVIAMLMMVGVGRQELITIVPHLVVMPLGAAAGGVAISISHRSLVQKLVEARRVGSYQLIEKLGQGGMGEVWLAKHHQLARPAAIKLISAAVGGESYAGSAESLERFEREAQTTALLTSPHTVTVYDFGISQANAFYCVMEALDGVTLKEVVIHEGPQPPARVVHWLQQICLSLAEAHRAGYVHRDIKPANIMATHYGAVFDFIKVLDFGLVREVRGKNKDGPRGFEGTPQYAAPEAVTARDPIATSQDIYSLGCVAYWLLTGAPPFEGESVLKVAFKHVSEVPQLPSDRVGTPIPASLEALVMRCLSKEPDSRPSADELFTRLGECGLEWSPAEAREAWSRSVDIAEQAEGDPFVDDTQTAA